MSLPEQWFLPRRGVSGLAGRSTGYLWLALPLLAGVTLGADTCTDNTTMVSMRDGTGLATDSFPTNGSRPAPTILFRTPYGREGMATTCQSLNQSGYAAVSQDMRGFGDSDGQFMMFTDDGWGTRQDGYDTIQWVAEQDWSNGDVCMYGASALSISSLLAAGSTPPALKCAYVLVGSGNLYYDVDYWGGVLREEMVVNWLQGLGQNAALDAVELHSTDDSFWDPVSLQDRYAAVDAAIYSVGGWYDIFSQGNLDVFSGVQTGGGIQGRGHQKLLMGPWSHGSAGPTVGELTFPDNSVLPAGEEMRWFDYHLKNVANGINGEPPVKYYLMGDVDTVSTRWNLWLTSSQWPVPSTPTSYYLRSGGGLSPLAPSGSEGASYFTYDPADPVPTVGGNNLVLPAGPYDQRSVESRDDVLIFQTPVLTEPLAITGRVSATLWIASSAVDTDFAVKVTDVYPDGRSMLVLDGIVRTRYREGSDHEVMMTPGAIYPISVDLWSTALVFNAGHQLRVAVSSSNSPRFQLNPNTGAPLAEEDGVLVVADQTVYHDASHPSQLILPVVPLP